MNNNINSMKDIEQYANLKRIPYVANIEILTGCNLNCVHCYIPEHNEQHIQFKELDKILRQLKKLGTFIVVLTGGEIFLRKDIFDIIGLCRKYGFRTILFSNVTLLDKEKIQLLKELYVYEISTSIYSLNSKIHDKITKIEGSLDKTLKNLERIKNIGINVEVKTPLMTYNKECFDEVKKFCEEKNYAFNAGTTIMGTTDGSRTNNNLKINKNDLPVIINKIELYKRSIRGRKSTEFKENEIVCKELKSTIFIDSMGYIYPCSAFPIKLGNIYKDKIENVWNSKEEKKIQSIKYKNLKECKECKYIKYCDICPGMNYIETGDYLSCSKAIQQVALIKYNNELKKEKNYERSSKRKK